jgi:hypothetical protein
MIIGFTILPVTEDGRIDLTRPNGTGGKVIKLPVNVDFGLFNEAEKAVRVTTQIALSAGFRPGEDGLWRNSQIIGQMFHDSAEVADWFLRQPK